MKPRYWFALSSFFVLSLSGYSELNKFLKSREINRKTSADLVLISYKDEGNNGSSLMAKEEASAKVLKSAVDTEERKTQINVFKGDVSTNFYFANRLKIFGRIVADAATLAVSCHYWTNSPKMMLENFPKLWYLVGIAHTTIALL
ncbi:MAG: hypothetical protein WA865_13195 [Spirulinaceae cyanobacterium]